LKQIRTYAGLFLVAAIVIGFDQWTKHLVRTNLPQSGTWLPAGLEWLSPYARIINWHNSGAAFGSFQGYGWVFTILAFVVAGLIIYYYPQVHTQDWWLRLAMGMQLGGAMGNVVDRLLFNGNVTDFISVGTFPVFNVADSSISVGVAILLLGALWKETKDKRDKEKQESGLGESGPAEEAPGAGPAQGSGEGLGE
jgi:signal peptidase II